MTLRTTVELGISSQSRYESCPTGFEIVTIGKQEISLCSVESVVEHADPPEIEISDAAMTEILYYLTAIRGLTADSPLVKLLDKLADYGITFSKGIGLADISPHLLKQCLSVEEKTAEPQDSPPENPEEEETAAEPVIGNNEPV